ncbi:RND superfamily putative drug exporter [Mumia flava]|uniref:RND superfamily putative drug exporter n=1 Tax=Mumia flava TaxID=1348852 RepID=A0A2M9BEY8_9ACTN|nr:MMPL family transporter [Mumia flava]PJJ56508.1 RND superfamily putative drug exporter [Mumia flava]
MSSRLYRWGRFAARRPWVVVSTWIVVAAAVIVTSGAVGRDLEDSFDAPGLDSQKAAAMLSAAGADQAGVTAQVVVTPRGGAAIADSPQTREALDALRGRILALGSVLDVTDPLAGQSGGISEDGRIALIRVQYPPVDDLRAADLDELKGIADGPEAEVLQIEMGGDLFFAFEEPPTGVGEVVGLIVALLVLLVAFGSIVAAGLPIGIALTGLAVSTSAMTLVAFLIDVPSWAPVLGGMIGLGVGIDYALFVVTRHREFLARGHAVDEAAGRAVATAGRAVLVAGGTVVIAILGLLVAGIPFVTAGGVAISLIVAVMALAAVTLLPALLGLAGHRIGRGGVRRRRDAATHPSVGAGWWRWGGHVSRHPRAYVVGAAVALLALAAPVLSLQLGFPDDGTYPESRTERRAYDLVADGFGPGSNGPLVIAVDTAGDPAVLEPLRTAVVSDPGVAAVAPAQLHGDTGVATLVAYPTTGPQDDTTRATIDRLRTEVFGQVLDGDAHAHVGGQTAAFSDLGDRVQERLPWFVLAVVLLSFVLLTVMFRSVLVPLKAAALNLLSIGAAYGVLVMVFQWGWGLGLIGVETTVPIVSFIPLFMFAILFGLSMDYEVFLISRIREEYLRTRDNGRSVIVGIARTARVITSAALIMISVFLGFAMGADPVVKMMGLGLATAILIDATVVRLVLVPAAMTLLGERTWWLPGWLDRILPASDGTHDADDPAGDHADERPSPEPEPEPEPTGV